MGLIYETQAEHISFTEKIVILFYVFQTTSKGNSQTMACAPNVSWRDYLLTGQRFCVTFSQWAVT